MVPPLLPASPPEPDAAPRRAALDACFGDVTSVHNVACTASREDRPNGCAGSLSCSDGRTLTIECKDGQCVCNDVGYDQCTCPTPPEGDDPCGNMNCCWH